jgi:hypothetical protein
MLMLLLSVGAASSGTLYPADITPQPVMAYGTVKLRSTYSGAALTACKTACTLSQTVNFIGDNLDTSTLDAFLASSVGQVSLWNDQMGTVFSPQGTALNSPSIQNLSIGGARSLIFQGSSQSGAIYWMGTPDISSLGITGNTWTIVAVVIPSSSQFYNQAVGFSSGALTNLYKTDGTTLVEIYNQSQAGASTSGPGAWQVTNSGAFDFQSPGYMVPVNPQVLTITSGTHGTRVYVNEQIRTTASRSALTDTVGFLRLGALGSSTVPDGHAYDGQITAFMIWNTELSENQAAIVRTALYDRFSINRSISDYTSYNVSIVGDSIASGYVTLGLFGYDQYLRSLVNHPTNTRIINNSIPGSTISVNPAAVVAYASTLGLFPTTVPLQIPQSKLGKVVVVHGGGNDALIGPVSRTGNTHSSALIDNISSTADLSVGDFVYVTGLSALSTIQSKTANSITLNNATSSTITGVSLLFTFAGNSPTVVYNAIKSLAISSITAGATGVIVSTVLPRDTTYQSYVASLNALLTGSGVPSATVVDCANYPGLNTNPGPDYADAVHPSALGHSHMASCLAPTINTMMP